MKKLFLTTTALMISSIACTAYAGGSPKEAGEEFAQAAACRIADQISKPQMDIINLKVMDEFKLGSRGRAWKKIMDDHRLNRFEEIARMNPVQVTIMCGIMKTKYF